MKRSRRVSFHGVVFLFGLYLGCYVVLSRQGYAEARRYNMRGFYYFSPKDGYGWRCSNCACMFLFYPLNLIDQVIGLGRSPGSEPLWGLSK